MTLARQSSGPMAQPKEGISVSRQVLRPRLPIVRVRQDQTQGEGTPGYFFYVDDQKEMDCLRGTPMAVQEGRIMFPTPFRSGEPPRCWSNDGVQAARGAEFMGTMCDACKFLFDGCNSTWQIVFRLLPEGKDIMLAVGAGMEQAVAALIAADVFREKLVTLTTRRIRTKRGAWFTLTLDSDMPLLSVDAKKAVELDFRRLYLPGMQTQAPAAIAEVPGNDTMPPQLQQDINDMYPQGHVEQRMVPPGVHPGTGEIIGSVPQAVLDAQDGEDGGDDGGFPDQHPGEMTDDDYDSGPPALDPQDGDYPDDDDVPF